MVLYSFNPCTQDAESGGSLGVLGQPALHKFQKSLGYVKIQSTQNRDGYFSKVSGHNIVLDNVTIAVIKHQDQRQVERKH